MRLGGLPGAVARIVCSVAGHRFVVWARAYEAPPRHPHLGAWSRCARCGHERDWLGERVARDARLLDLVHGVVRPLHEIVAIARGERAPEPVDVPEVGAPASAAPVVSISARRPARRGSGEGRSSTRREARPRATLEREPQDP